MDEMAKVIDKIAEKLGTKAEIMWPYFVDYIYSKAITNLIMLVAFVVCVAGISGVILKATAHYKKKDPHCDYYMGYIIASIIALLAMVIATCVLPTILPDIMNSEGAAFHYLFRIDK